MATVTLLDRKLLDETVLVVVNGKSEFGRSICRELAVEYSKIVIVGDENAEVDVKLGTSLRAAGIVDSIEKSVMPTSDAVTTQIRSIVDVYGRIDAFVYILPESDANSLATIDTTTWQDAVSTLSTMFWYYRAVAKQMAKQRNGSIVGVNFGVNARGDGEMLTWTIMGEALVGMSKCLAVELLKQNVRVNTIGYGYMEEAKYPSTAHSVMKDYAKFLGINRRGKTADVTNLLKLLISDGGSYITGQSMYVNGGLLI